MDTLQYWQAIAEAMIKIPAPSEPSEPAIPPHAFPLKSVRFSGRMTDKTNFTKLQELWNGVEKPLEIQTAGHRTHNLTTKLK